MNLIHSKLSFAHCVLGVLHTSLCDQQPRDGMAHATKPGSHLTNVQIRMTYSFDADHLLNIITDPYPC